MDELPLGEKFALTLPEASAYFNIGINKLRDMTNTDASDCALLVGKKRLIKRVLLEDYLNTAYSI